MNETITFSLSGEIDHHSAGAWRQRAEKELSGADGCRVIISMKDVSFMDSSGVGLLIGIYNRMCRRGCITQLADVPPSADAVLRISGIYGIMGKVTLNKGR